ncbi:MAG: hypothetical protein K0R00_4154 [Herbinix sp.]|nr:hypothetical protein [Herbinix sp.]
MNKNPFKTKQYATSKIYRARPQDIERPEEERPNVPQGIMTKCPKCGKVIYTKLLLKNYKRCDECGHNFKVSSNERIAMILDDGELLELDAQVTTRDPLGFPGYGDKLIKTQTQTGLVDGIVTGKGKIDGLSVLIGVMDAAFFMGSMGTAVGDKLARLFERGIKERLFAMLGDIILAEPGALIGFAGPRVIEQTIGQKLPEGFQRAEFLLEHGFVDQIVPRDQLKNTLGTILKLHSPAAGNFDDRR